MKVTRIALPLIALSLLLLPSVATAGSWPIDCKDNTSGFSISLNHFSKKAANDYTPIPTFVAMSRHKKVLIPFKKAKRIGRLVHLIFKDHTVVYSGTKTPELRKNAAIYDKNGQLLGVATCK